MVLKKHHQCRTSRTSLLNLNLRMPIPIKKNQVKPRPDTVMFCTLTKMFVYNKTLYYARNKTNYTCICVDIIFSPCEFCFSFTPRVASLKAKVKPSEAVPSAAEARPWVENGRSMECRHASIIQERERYFYTLKYAIYIFICAYVYIIYV